jgi:hypothetical protein
MPMLGSDMKVRRLRISVPLVEALLDGERYMREEDPARQSAKLKRRFERQKQRVGRSSPNAAERELDLVRSGVNRLLT